MKYLIRILTLPILLIIVILKNSYYWIKYGARYKAEMFYEDEGLKEILYKDQGEEIFEEEVFVTTWN